MTRIAVLVEVEELLFDTLLIRAHALQAALETYGITTPLAEVQRVHTGTTAAMALELLLAARALDDTARELTLRRAGDEAQRAMLATAPPFVPEARDALFALTAEFPVGVVTRGGSEEVQHLLDITGLGPYIGTVRSLRDVAADEQHTVWRSAMQRMRIEHGVALAPAPLLSGATQAGLRTVSVGLAPPISASTHLASLRNVQASFITSLIDTR
jgi:beta-phosphoglucomutase-like phosphatase (HAD superfamily)